jgi:uncharacterized membrane protein YeiB
MTTPSFKTLFTSSFIILGISVAAFLYFAICIPNVVSSNVINDSNKDVEQVLASSDLHQLQQIATRRIQEEVYVMDASRILLFTSLAVFLLCIFLSLISLWGLRRLKKRLTEAKSPS